jgi:hypothetical protein
MLRRREYVQCVFLPLLAVSLSELPLFLVAQWCVFFNRYWPTDLQIAAPNGLDFPARAPGALQTALHAHLDGDRVLSQLHAKRRSAALIEQTVGNIADDLCGPYADEIALAQILQGHPSKYCSTNHRFPASPTRE